MELPGVESADIDLKARDRATITCRPTVRLDTKKLDDLLKPFGARVLLCYRDVEQLTDEALRLTRSYARKEILRSDACRKLDDGPHRTAIRHVLGALATLRDLVRTPDDTMLATDPLLLDMFTRLDAHTNLTSARGFEITASRSTQDALAIARQATAGLTERDKLHYHTDAHERIATFLDREFIADYCRTLEQVAVTARRIADETHGRPKRANTHARFGALATTTSALAELLAAVR